MIGISLPDWWFQGPASAICDQLKDAVSERLNSMLTEPAEVAVVTTGPGFEQQIGRVVAADHPDAEAIDAAVKDVVWRELSPLIDEALAKLIERARRQFDAALGESKTNSNLRIYIRREELVRDAAEAIDATSEFAVVSELLDIAGGPSRRGDEQKFYLSESLRQNGTYLAVGQGFSVDPTQIRKILNPEAAHKKLRVMALLDDVAFESNDIEFEDFHIRRFAPEELDAIVNPEVVRTFYPGRLLDANVLSRYWWIDIKEPSATLDCVMADPLRMILWQTHVRDSALHSVLTVLATSTFRTECFNIGAEVRILENHVPHLEYLRHIAPASYDVALARGNRRRSPQNEWIDIDAEDEESMVESYNHDLRSMKFLEPFKTVWRQYFVGLVFLVRGRMERSDASVVWRITALESFLTVDREAIGRVLGQRAARLIGRSSEERKSVQRQVRAAYSLRSAIVHGEPDRQIPYTPRSGESALFQLPEDLAWRVAIGLEVYLLSIAVKCQTPENAPTYPDVLRGLDFDDPGRAAFAIDASERLWTENET